METGPSFIAEAGGKVVEIRPKFSSACPGRRRGVGGPRRPASRGRTRLPWPPGQCGEPVPDDDRVGADARGDLGPPGTAAPLPRARSARIGTLTGKRELLGMNWCNHRCSGCEERQGTRLGAHLRGCKGGGFAEAGAFTKCHAEENFCEAARNHLAFARGQGGRSGDGQTCSPRQTPCRGVPGRAAP